MTTHQALIDAARDKFAGKGFSSVTVDEIAQAAGLTKGAFYHHFASKTALFEATLEAVESELQQHSRRATRQAQTVPDRLLLGTAAYLDAVTQPANARIALIDGPVVLGMRRYQQLVSRYALDDIALLLGTLLPELGPRQVDVMARMVIGALASAAQAVLASDEPEDALAHARDALDALLRGIIEAAP